MSNQLKNYDFFLKELPRLLEEQHEGQLVLIKDQQIIKLFVNLDDALSFAYQTYGCNGEFIIQEVRDESKYVSYINPEFVIKAN